MNFHNSPDSKEWIHPIIILPIAIDFILKRGYHILIINADLVIHEMNLPLHRGNKFYHDWHWILNKTGLLKYCVEIGLIIFSLAVLTFLITIFVPLIIKN